MRDFSTICDGVQLWTDRQPDRRLYAFLDSKGDVLDELSYEQFARRVDTIAVELQRRDRLQHGDRIILTYQPGIEIISAFFACAKIGLVAVPAPPLMAFGFKGWASQVAHVAKDCDAKAWLTCGRTLELFADCCVKHADDPERVAVDTLAALPAICSTSWPTDQAARAEARPHAVALMQYTSGSTSQPKGVCVSHENLIANCRAVVDHAQPVTVTWLPQNHDMGLIGYYIYIAMSGGTTFGMSPRSFIQRPSIWLELLSRYRATATSVPNFALEMCLDERRVPADTLGRYDLSALSFLMVAAEPVSPATFEAFRNRFAVCGLSRAAFFVAFGLAEFTLAVTSYGRMALSVDRRALALGKVTPVTETHCVAHALPIMSCGVPFGDVDLRIVDADSGIEVDIGHSGEIWVSGKSLAKGYWNKPELTRRTFEAKLTGAETEKPFLRTGDIGFVHDGELFVCGRLKDMMIIRGRNIYSEDIEACARQSAPDLRGNAVIAFASVEGGDQRLTVVAEVASHCEVPDAEQICRAVLERLQVSIDRIVFVPRRAIPRTSSGKVRRQATRTSLEEGTLCVLSDENRSYSSAQSKNTGAIHELELLKERYRLTGDEEMTLIEAGIDSLDLVVFVNWFKDTLIDRGAEDLSQRVNTQFLSMVSIRNLFEAARKFDAAPAEAVQNLTTVFAQLISERLQYERKLMLADKSYEVDTRLAHARARQTINTLITGGTGFLGPFLIDKLLGQSSHKITALVRGRDAEDARQRLKAAFFAAIIDTAQRAQFEKRVTVIPGDLEAPHLGLEPTGWRELTESVDTLYHNGALVNYLHGYETLRAANVDGTKTILDLCFAGRSKVLNYISTTFIFGWAETDFLHETDRNDRMEKLDFGYSQTKWAAEQKVYSAMEKGLPARVFRPALITPSLNGGGGNLDITVRLLAFMIRHGLGVSAGNQVSFMPADIAANNIIAISLDDSSLGKTFHVVRDDLETMSMITELIAKKTGIHFEMFDLPSFVPQVIKRCTRADPLYPLLDFLVGSVDNISLMEFKRYQSGAYQTARNNIPAAQADPPLDVVVDGILSFLKQNALL